MTKISMIMPVFNSEKYLRSAIKSVLNQTFKDFELLLIDDGSTDNSGKICDEVAKEDSRVRVFHQSNSGIAKTRNTGISKAIGKYIGFMDNDDILETDILFDLYEMAIKYNADVIKFGYKVEETFKNGKLEIRDKHAERFIEVLKKYAGANFEEVKKSGYFNMIWNGIYRREFIVKNQICFDEKIKRGYEDWIFNYKCYPIADRQIIIPTIGYIHYQRLTHSTSKQFHPNQEIAILQALQNEADMFELIDKNYLLTYNWYLRVYDYLIEYILLFERAGCRYSMADKCKSLERIKVNLCFSILKNKEYFTRLTANKKITVKLFNKEKYKILFKLSHYYYKYIVWKKTKY